MDDDRFYTYATCYLIVLMSLSIPLNLSVIWTYYRQKKVRTVLNTIILNLSINDLIIAILGGIPSCINAAMGKWVFGKFYCTIYAFIMSWFGVNTIVTLSNLAVIRYLIVCRGFEIPHLSPKNGNWLIFITWVYSLFWTCMPFFGWGEFSEEGSGISCSITWYKPMDIVSKSYIMALFVFGLFIPLILIGFSYYKMIRRITKTDKSIQLQESVLRQQSWGIKMNLYLVIILFIVSWAPYACLTFYVTFFDWNAPTMIIAIPSLVAKASGVWNPILSWGRNKQFYSAWKQEMFGWCNKRSENDVGKNISEDHYVIEMQISTIVINPPTNVCGHSENGLETVVSESSEMV